MYNVNFPPIDDALQNATTMDDLWSKIIVLHDNAAADETLDLRSRLFCKQLSNQLRLIKKLMCPSNLEYLNNFFNDFQRDLQDWGARTSINLVTSKRQKAFLAFLNKIKLFLLTAKPLSTLNDVLGYRIVVGDSPIDSKESIANLYAFTNYLITTLTLDYNCSFLVAETRNGPRARWKDKRRLRRLGGFIPKKSLVMREFQNNIKDYVFFPKRNGYQSLHLYIELPNGLIIEFQIRTHAMNVLAEENPMVSHNRHKRSRYGNLLIPPKVDPNLIKISGFSSEDTVGLFDSITSFRGIPKS